MTVERPRQIQRCLKPGFLTFVIVDQEKDIFHHRLLRHGRKL